jgi:hypothetical protein
MCPEKRTSSPRGVSLDRAKAMITKMDDDAFGDLVAFVTDEVMLRRQRVADEAQARLRKFDAILRPPAVIAEERSFLDDVTTRAANATRDVEGGPKLGKPISPPSYEPSPTPKAFQCPAINPSDVTMKCSQPKNHEGAHYNHKMKTSWVKRA